MEERSMYTEWNSILSSNIRYLLWLLRGVHFNPSCKYDFLILIIYEYKENKLFMHVFRLLFSYKYGSANTWPHDNPCNRLISTLHTYSHITDKLLLQCKHSDWAMLQFDHFSLCIHLLHCCSCVSLRIHRECFQYAFFAIFIRISIKKFNFTQNSQLILAFCFQKILCSYKISNAYWSAHNNHLSAEFCNWRKLSEYHDDVCSKSVRMFVYATFCWW